MRVGAIELLALSDGTLHVDPEFYVGLDVQAHPDLLAADGRAHVPIGCFLLRSGGTTVLVDTGIGPVTNEWATGGLLPAALREHGVPPEDVDVVVVTHLHLDHIGGLLDGGEAAFPNATVRFGQDDWDEFVTRRDPADRNRRIMEALEAAGRLEPLDERPLAPGVHALATPGHTPGHHGIVVASGDERVYLLGDAVECPLQLSEPDFSALSDVDPALAARTREALWRELEGTDAQITGAHFPGLELGRVLRGTGRRFVPA